MAYLVAKYCLVFLITGLLGFLIGRWSMRRLFVDVTDSFETLTETSRAATDAPWEEIRNRFDAISGNVQNIVRNEFRANPYPEIPRGLFSKLENGLSDLKQSIANLPAPERVDFSAVNYDLQQLHRAVGTLSQNVADKVATHDDIETLGQTLERQLAQLANDVATVPELVETPIIDLEPLEQKIASLQLTVENLPQPLQVDLAPIQSRLGDVERQIAGLPGEISIEPTDFAPLANELGALRAQMSQLVANTEIRDPNIALVAEKLNGLEKSINDAAFQTQNALDIDPLLERADRLESLIRVGNDESAETSQRLATVDENVKSLFERDDKLPLGELSSALGGIETRMAEIASLTAATNNSGQRINQQLNQLDRHMESLQSHRLPTEKELSSLSKNVDSLRDEIQVSAEERREFEQSTFSKRFDQLENTLETRHAAQLKQMAPIDQRLSEIHNKLSALNALAPEVISENGSRPSIGPKLLKRPEFGKKDNLQQIAGIGPKLEQSLNKLGVYYYWQIAAWNKRDIRTVDANLEAFRGRIERDDWVSQAKLLRKLSHVSRSPSGREMAQKLN